MRILMFILFLHSTPSKDEGVVKKPSQSTSLGCVRKKFFHKVKMMNKWYKRQIQANSSDADHVRIAKVKDQVLFQEQKIMVKVKANDISRYGVREENFISIDDWDKIDDGDAPSIVIRDKIFTKYSTIDQS